MSLRCPAKRDRTKYFANKEPRDACQLCVTPAINKILEAQKLEGPCNVTASKDLCSNLRSSFVITRYRGYYYDPVTYPVEHTLLNINI